MEKIVSEFVQTLHSMPKEALLRPELAHLIQSVVLREVQSNGAKLQGTTATGGQGFHDPYMTRGAAEAQKSNTKHKKSGIKINKEIQNKNAGLDSTKTGKFDGVPDTIRTYDLQLRRLTL